MENVKITYINENNKTVTINAKQALYNAPTKELHVIVEINGVDVFRTLHYKKILKVEDSE